MSFASGALLTGLAACVGGMSDSPAQAIGEQSQVAALPQATIDVPRDWPSEHPPIDAQYSQSLPVGIADVPQPVASAPATPDQVPAKAPSETSPAKKQKEGSSPQRAKPAGTFSSDAWLGFFGNAVGAAVGAGVAILLWHLERRRENFREEQGKRLRWEQNKAWLLISMDEVHADFNIELQMIRLHAMSTNALLNVPNSLDPAHVASGTDQGLLEYLEGIKNLVAFADEARRTLPPLQAEYVSWYEYDWCQKYSKLDAAVRNFRQIMAAISLPTLALEPVQQLNGILNRAAVAGKDIDAQFDAVITQLRGITL